MKDGSLLASHIEKIVGIAVTKYTQRCVRVSADDLRQAAWVACLEALRTYRVGSGTLSGYLWRAALLSIRRELWTTSTITSGHRHRPEVSVRKVSHVGIRTASEADPKREATSSVVLIDDTPLPDEIAAAHEVEALAIEALQRAGVTIELSRAFFAGTVSSAELPRGALRAARETLRETLRH